MARLLVVVALVGVVVVLAAVYRRRRAADIADRGDGLPPLPSAIADGADPTWVIFTTPLCVSCDAIENDLRSAFPEHLVLKVDATEQPDLADRYRVRRAPTVVFAQAGGRIDERLVGPEAVRAHLATASAS